MPARNTSRGPVLQWVVVLVVGIVVVTLVLGLNLISRLNAGQDVLNAAKPAYVTQGWTPTWRESRSSPRT
jgi:hypothetical protein